MNINDYDVKLGNTLVTAFPPPNTSFCIIFRHFVIMIIIRIIVYYNFDKFKIPQGCDTMKRTWNILSLKVPPKPPGNSKEHVNTGNVHCPLNAAEENIKRTSNGNGMCW